ncbi:hypothetical protein DKL61_01360 [Gammaproteobacteria bacterium ESL0073]|nr:hypothetical protein DKL61_01360 [Gammaproteobacteria bacterium ESL0073]
MIEQDSIKKTALDVSLITLVDRTLAIPSSAIVEVIHVTVPQVVGKMPRWFLGFLPWQGLRIPFISFEGICGAGFKINNTSNILILKTITPTLQCKFIALLIQDVPMARPITEDMVIDVVGDLSKYELENIKINEFVAKIPDMPAIERLLVQTAVLV